jgi:hypothetical protein
MVPKKSYSIKITLIFKFSLLIIFVLFSNCAIPQNTDNWLSYDKGNVYDMRMNNLDYSQIKYFMKDNPDALSYIKRAKTFQIIGTSIEGSGVLCFVFVLVIGNAMISSGEYNDYEYNLFWVLFASGSALFGTGLAINSGYRKNLKTAVSIYNNAHFNRKSVQGYTVKIGLTSGGVGFAVQF